MKTGQFHSITMRPWNENGMTRRTEKRFDAALRLRLHLMANQATGMMVIKIWERKLRMTKVMVNSKISRLIPTQSKR